MKSPVKYLGALVLVMIVWALLVGDAAAFHRRHQQARACAVTTAATRTGRHATHYRAHVHVRQRQR